MVSTSIPSRNMTAILDTQLSNQGSGCVCLMVKLVTGQELNHAAEVREYENVKETLTGMNIMLVALLLLPVCSFIRLVYFANREAYACFEHQSDHNCLLDLCCWHKLNWMCSLQIKYSLRLQSHFHWFLKSQWILL